MNERITILYDRTLRPEWIDFALESYVKSSNEKDLSLLLRKYLEVEISEATTLRKTVSQLQRVVGFLSIIPQETLYESYKVMIQLSPNERTNLRLKLLVESTPFVADVVNSIKKLVEVGVNGIQVNQLYERIINKYGDRGTVPRRVRYVLQTLFNFGILENKDSKWFLIDKDSLFRCL